MVVSSHSTMLPRCFFATKAKAAPCALLESPSAINLIAEQSVYISDVDFKKLTGHEITEFGSEGRLMMGNLAAATNCTIDTTSGTAVFTRRPARPTAGVWTTLSKQKANDQSDPAKLSA
jgi:hypothetical protein